ncbi:MAG: UTP--glucose-1-phosphate uridylyltransferase [Dehalococcoidia bacterium]|nr:UTP--glucose-1-phosphate uridylyltransferase [Dehalococcoidia bacterium]
MQVRKAVIPAAGWGTRFLPVTRAYPKELLPLVNKPLIQIAVEEAVASGIEEVIIVVAAECSAIRNYFRPIPELGVLLEQRGDSSLAEEMRCLESLVRISYVSQCARLGLGHAVLSAREALGDEPFAVILPDDVVDSSESALSQMLRIFCDYGGSVLGVESIKTADIQRYGVIRPETVGARVHRVRSLIEKPSLDITPSQLGIVGRYILTPQIFDAIAAVGPGHGGEIQLTDALSILLETQPIYALEFYGRRFDVGSPLGWLEAQVAFGIRHSEYGDILRQKLRHMV